jgi:hypothetical protein
VIEQFEKVSDIQLRVFEQAKGGDAPLSGFLQKLAIIQPQAARKQLARLADMTMRAFVLDALKAKGLDVRPDDLADLRKERPNG